MKDYIGNDFRDISSLEYLKMNGTKQYVLIRGSNTNKPILLYVHGGPGIPEMPLIKHYSQDLEKHFIIVYWEQRGAGKSYSKNIPSGTYTIDQFVSDGLELTKLLLKRFRKEKIFIMGHSWGTIISTRLVLLHSELYYAYFGIGQMVDLKRAEELSYDFVLSKAKESNKTRAINALKNINTPPYLTIDNNKDWYQQLKIQRKWLTHFGGLVYKKKNLRQFLQLFIKSPEYSFMDMVRIARGNVVSIKKLWPEIMKVKLIDEIISFKIPVYFFQGKHDYNCPTALVTEYFNKILAPTKEIIIFENSAHNPNYEESNKFNDIIIKLIKKLN